MTTARTKRWALASSGLVAALFAFVGVAHTPLGRPMLAWLRGAPGCPVGGQLDAEATAAVRARLTTPMIEPGAAAAGELLGGLQPGRSTREDVRRWSEHHGLRCSDPAHCEGTLPGLAQASVVLHFAGERLLDVEVTARTEAPDDALAAAVALDTALGQGAKPYRADGADDPQSLSRGPLSQRRREYRFADLRTEVRATNLGPRGYLVRGFAQALGTS